MEKGQIFVFGSNEAGRHGGGATRGSDYNRVLDCLYLFEAGEKFGTPRFDN